MRKHLLELGKSSAIYGLGSMINRFMGLLLLPIFTAYLNPAEYGILAMLALLTLVAHPIFSLGTGAAMGPSYFEGNDDLRRSKAVWTTFTILLCSVAILVTIAWSMPVWLSRIALGTPEHSFLVSLALTGCAATILSTPFMQRLQFEDRALTYVLITVTTALITIILSLITVVHLAWGVQGMVISQLTGNAVALTLFAAYSARGTHFKICKAVATEILKFGLPLIPSFAFLFIMLQGNKYVLQWLSGLQLVGVYSIGFNFGAVLGILTGAVSTAWYPFFLKFIDNQEEGKKVFSQIFSMYLICFGLITISFFVVSGPLISLMTDQQYHDASIVVGYVALAHFFLGIFSLLLPPIYFAKQVQKVSLTQGAASLLSIPLTIALVAQWGLIGAAVAVAASHFVLCLFQYLLNRFLLRDFSFSLEVRPIVLVAAGISASALFAGLIDLRADLAGLGVSILTIVISGFIILSVMPKTIGRFSFGRSIMKNDSPAIWMK